MIRLLQWLIHGHIHEWETIEKCDLLQKDGTRIGRIYYLRCRKCGIVKRVNLS